MLRTRAFAYPWSANSSEAATMIRRRVSVTSPRLALPGACMGPPLKLCLKFLFETGLCQGESFSQSNSDVRSPAPETKGARRRPLCFKTTAWESGRNGGPWLALTNGLGDLGAGDGGGDQEALDLVATERPEHGFLLGRLDALGQDAFAQGVPHGHDRRDDRGRIRVRAQPVHEDAVDLDEVHREALEVRHRREAGAEVVQRDAMAALGQLLQQRRDRFGAFHEHALGHLDLEVGR